MGNNKAVHYRQRAAEMRSQADRCEGPLRASYLTVAKDWERLATQAEQELAASLVKSAEASSSGLGAV